MVRQKHSPTKFAPSDWKTSNHVIASSAERQRSTAHDIRQQSQRLRNDTENCTLWTQHDNDTRLDIRTGEIQNWIDTLTKTLHDTEEEIDKLSEHKERTEKALEVKTMPLEVALGCLTLREGRVAIDLVRDEVELKLNKEVEVIEEVRSMLHQKVQEAFQQICVLQDCHRQLYFDLTDKHSGLQIDSESLKLKNSSSNIAMQADPTRIMKDIVTPNQWKSFSAHNVAKAESEIQTSTSLREAMNQCILQTTSKLEALWIDTNYAFRKRIQEVEQAKHELEWQLSNTEQEIAEVETEIKGLEQSLADKVPPMMVAHTRLENRTVRPNMELCRDTPQYGIVGEVADIAESQMALREKLDVARRAEGALNRTLNRIQQDLLVKNNSLALDQQCTETRKMLTQHPKGELAKPKPNAKSDAK